jgi:NADH-quinone oxidoreductase subunit J
MLTTISAAAAVMAGDLLIGAIMLALVSIGASLILFDFMAPWAAVFELSVCAGLITVLFVGAVSLVRGNADADARNRVKFLVLPLAAAGAAIILWFTLPAFFEALSSGAMSASVNNPIGITLWDIRRPDLLGQTAMFAAGVFVIKSIFPRRNK